MAMDVIDSLRINVICSSKPRGQALEEPEPTTTRALLDLPELHIEEFLGLNKRGVTYAHEPYRLRSQRLVLNARGRGHATCASKTGRDDWCELCPCPSQRIGASVAIGHTHKLGLVPTSHMVRAKIHRIDWGFEVGCILDFKCNPGWVQVHERSCQLASRIPCAIRGQGQGDSRPCPHHG